MPVCSALGDLEAARRLDPDDPAVNEELGRIYRNAGQYGKAMNYYAAATLTDPGWTSALVEQSKLLATPPADAGDQIPRDTARAMMLARQACKVRLTSECTAAMARVYAVKGQWRLATQGQRLAVALQGGPVWRKSSAEKLLAGYEAKRVTRAPRARWDIDLSVCAEVESDSPVPLETPDELLNELVGAGSGEAGVDGVEPPERDVPVGNPDAEEEAAAARAAEAKRKAAAQRAALRAKAEAKRRKRALDAAKRQESGRKKPRSVGAKYKQLPDF